MAARIFYVPVVLAIEADNPHIATDEAKVLAERIAAEDRHLRKDVIVPARSDQVVTFTCPQEGVVHRGITD